MFAVSSEMKNLVIKILVNHFKAKINQQGLNSDLFAVTWLDSICIPKYYYLVDHDQAI